MTLLSGRYELAGLLGAGGMARVFAAHDVLLDRPVAIKLIDDAGRSDPVGRKRLIFEARAAAALQHPNTVAVFDVGADAEPPYIVMEFVAGRSLAELIQAQGRLSAAEVVEIGDGVLAGLSAAHRRGLVHRDVKPSNILLADEGTVKVADFGIAMALAESSNRLTAAGQVLGTPNYLAPECVAGRQASPASDLYSVGAVLYECLAGHAPFQAATPVAVAVAHQHQLVPPLAEVAPDVPVALAEAVERALAKEPSDRFANADEMRLGLQNSDDAGVTPRLPVQATGVLLDAPSEARTFRSWPLLAGLGVVAAVTLVIVLALVFSPDDDPGETSTPPDPGDVADGAPEDDLPVGEPLDDVADLDDLIGQVAQDPDRGGVRGDDLLDELRDLREEGTAEDARELMLDVGEWIVSGEVPREFGEAVVATLEQTSRPDDAGLDAVSQTFANLAYTWPQWGENADTLRDELRNLLDTDPGEVDERAADLDDQLSEWMSAGEIHDDLGTWTRAVLEPLIDVQG